MVPTRGTYNISSYSPYTWKLKDRKITKSHVDFVVSRDGEDSPKDNICTHTTYTTRGLANRKWNEECAAGIKSSRSGEHFWWGHGHWARGEAEMNNLPRRRVSYQTHTVVQFEITQVVS